MELCLFVDHDCNLRCRYCYNGQKQSRRMSPATAERAIEFALARDPTDLALSFFGGEPLLALELLEHATAYAERRLSETAPEARLSVHLTTNATLVNERVEDFVRRNLPLNAFVSIDGSPLIHDRHRIGPDGLGSHAAVRAGISRLVAAGANVIALSVVNPDTAGALGEVVTELASLPIDRAHVTCNLRTPWDERALESLREGAHAAARVWGELFRTGRCIQLEPFVMKVLSHLYGEMPCPSRCQMKAYELIVAPSGRIYGCGEQIGEDHEDQWVIGNLDTGIWWEKLARLRAAKEGIQTTCQSCALVNRCASNCGCRQIALTGVIGQVTEAFCAIEEAFIAAADSIATDLYRESCPAFLDFFYREPWTPNTPEGLAQLRRSASL